MRKIKKSQFVEELATKLYITSSESERFVNTFFEFIYDTLEKGGEVNFSGFGKFKVSHRMPRIGVNPRNPVQKITIPELKTPKFVAGEAFKEAVRIK